MADVDRLSDLDIAEDATEHAAVADPEDASALVADEADPESALAVEDAPEEADPQRRGLLRGLFARRADPEADPVEVLPQETEVAEDIEAIDPEAADTAEVAALQPLDLPEVAEIEDQERPRTGLLGFLSRKAEEAKDEEEPSSLDIAKKNDPAELVKLAALGEPAAPKAKPRNGGLFGFGRKPKTPKGGAPDYQQVGPNVVLPYGEIAQLCGVPIGKLGKKVAKYPETGRGFVIYDSDPDSTDPRNFYVTGFDDGCARQFTAALVMFGAASMHELLRYGLPAEVHPYSATDKAYEKIKRRICGVGRNKPCGEKIAEVEKTTVFVSVYERFGSNPRWKTILLHDGALVATDIKESDES